MPAPENTTGRDHFTHMVGLIADPDAYITGMEADGQRQLVNSDTLPSDAPWPELEALGFTPGKPVPGDSLFRHCALPEGWKREGSDHAMWSYIVDQRGVRRVSVFYKAAFYDRGAHASVSSPGAAFATEAIYGDGPAELPALWGVLTDEERQDFRDSLTGYLTRAEEHPGIYGDRVERVQRLVELAR